LAGGATWDLRPDNVIAYISPNMNGLTGAVAYVTNTNAGAALSNSVTALSAMGTYETGPLMVGLGYEKHNLSNLGGGISDEKAYRLVGGYSFGDFKVTALYQKIADALDTVHGGAEANTDRKTWGLGGAYKMGATTLKLQYYKADDKTSCGTGVDCGATGANMVALGADYSLSKRTTAYVAYAKTNNDSNATGGASFSAFGGGHGDNPGTVAGKDPSGFAVGMKHSF